MGTKNFPNNVVVTAPHGSSKVPISVFPFLQPHYQTSPRLLLNFSDYGTQYLIENVPLDQQVMPKYGRIIGDPNRSRDAEDIVRFEDFGGVNIFRENFEKRLTTSILRSFWLKKLLMMSYEPFYRDVFLAIDRAVKNTEDPRKPIILVDVHDTGNRILGRHWREDKSRKLKKMPPVVISNAPDEEVDEGVFGTAPKYFIHDFREKLADKLGIEESEVELNTVFKGGYMIRYFGNPSVNRRLRKILKDRKIVAVQIEFDRALYLDEVTQRPIGWKVKSVRNSLIETICELCEDL